MVQGVVPEHSERCCRASQVLTIIVSNTAERQWAVGASNRSYRGQISPLMNKLVDNIFRQPFVFFCQFFLFVSRKVCGYDIVTDHLVQNIQQTVYFNIVLFSPNSQRSITGQYSCVCFLCAIPYSTILE